MTLNTNVFINGEIDPHEVFHYCRGLLGANDSHPFTDKQDDWEGAGSWTIGNGCGIGLPAWLMLHYRVGAPLRTDGDACTDSCDKEAGEDAYHHHPPAHWLLLWFDTAYSYKGEDGRGCGDLHASLVAQLGRWLDERGVAWSWQNEFNGEIHGGPDRYERLGDICSSGAEASAWFESTVKPAIEAEIASRAGS